MRRAIGWMRRSPWIVALIALGSGAILAARIAVDAEFYRAFVATYIGAALGFFVALFVDRLQRSEDDKERHSAEAVAEQRAQGREAETARVRRVAVVSLLRAELGRVPDQMGTSDRQARNFAPNDLMTDILWRTMSASGELRWIQGSRPPASDRLCVRLAGRGDRYRAPVARSSIARRDRNRCLRALLGQPASVARSRPVEPGMSRLQGDGRLARCRWRRGRGPVVLPLAVAEDEKPTPSPNMSPNGGRRSL